MKTRFTERGSNLVNSIEESNPPGVVQYSPFYIQGRRDCAEGKDFVEGKPKVYTTGYSHEYAEIEERSQENEH